MNAQPQLIHDRIGARAPILFALLCLLGFGLLYSALTSSLVAGLFPNAAAGSLVAVDGRTVGSAWVAQAFADDRYFYSRPSAANYDPMAASGSNLARSNPALTERMNSLRKIIAAREQIDPAMVPAELLTASGSGFDPHLSPAGAAVQIARVARARGLPEAVVAEQVQRATEPPLWGLLGAPRVSVLKLNVALDGLARDVRVQDQR